MNSVFITGGSSGLGLELAKHYSDLGNIVGICSRSKFTYPYLYSYQADITKPNEIKNAISTFLKENNLKSLDVFIANAGTSNQLSSIENDPRGGNTILMTNIIGTINSVEAAKVIFLEQGFGQIVFISSLASLNGLPGSAHYCASKAAISAFAQAMTIELMDKNIHVTTILPGYIKTELTRECTNMPMAMEPEFAAKKIITAIKKKKYYYSFPFPLNIGARFISILPRAIARFIIKTFKITV